MVSVETEAPIAALAAPGMASSSARVVRGLIEAVVDADVLSGVSKVKCLRTVSAAPRAEEVLPRVVWGRASQNSNEWLGTERRGS